MVNLDEIIEDSSFEHPIYGPVTTKRGCKRAMKRLTIELLDLIVKFGEVGSKYTMDESSGKILLSHHIDKESVLKIIDKIDFE
jgi:ribosomal protein L32